MNPRLTRFARCLGFQLGCVLTGIGIASIAISLGNPWWFWLIFGLACMACTSWLWSKP